MRRRGCAAERAPCGLWRRVAGAGCVLSERGRAVVHAGKGRHSRAREEREKEREREREKEREKERERVCVCV